MHLLCSAQMSAAYTTGRALVPLPHGVINALETTMSDLGGSLISAASQQSEKVRQPAPDCCDVCGAALHAAPPPVQCNAEVQCDAAQCQTVHCQSGSQFATAVLTFAKYMGTYMGTNIDITPHTITRLSLNRRCCMRWTPRWTAC